MKCVYLDCEFLVNDFSPAGLISIGITTKEASYYAVNANMDQRAVQESKWLRENVWNHLPTIWNRRESGIFTIDMLREIFSFRRMNTSKLNMSHADVRPYSLIREEVGSFFRSACLPYGDSRDGLRMFANCGGQDIVRLHTLWSNDWSAMPRQIPRYLDDIERLIIDSGVSEDQLPQQPEDQKHHALMDAEYDQKVHQFLLELDDSR